MGSLCGTAAKPDGPSDCLGHSCQLGLHKCLMSLLQGQGSGMQALDVSYVHVIERADLQPAEHRPFAQVLVR